MTRCGLAVVCALVLASPAAARPLDPVVPQTARLAAPGGHGEHGWSVAVDGSTIAVGVPFHGDGEVLVYQRPAGGWKGTVKPRATLVPPPGQTEHFGWTVAISHNTIAVGSIDHFQEPGFHPPGHAYVFARGARWSGTRRPSAALVPTTLAAGDVLGDSVSIDGTTVVVGAPGHAGTGAVFVFTKPGGGWSGVRRQARTLTPSDGRKLDAFGSAVALTGTTVAVGARQHRISRLLLGQAYVFDARSGREQAKLRTTLRVGGSGVSVAAAGATIVVGTGQADNSGPFGQAFVYQRPAGGWRGTLTETARLRVPAHTAEGTCGVPGELGADQAFGNAVAISGDRIVASAAPYGIGSHHYTGKACVFTQPPAGWTGTITAATTLVPAGGAEGDLYASNSPNELAVSGPTVVAGAPLRHKGVGAAYVY